MNFERGSSAFFLYVTMMVKGKITNHLKFSFSAMLTSGVVLSTNLEGLIYTAS